METKEVFNSVASKYDIMNDVMSMGVHRYWKELMIDWLSPHEEMKIIDVAGGTGDISRRFLKRVNGKGRAIVCDPNENMVEAGKRIKQYSDDIEWVVAPAEELPFEDNTFDAYLVSFGVRNFSDLKKSLGEAKRVLKPGGRFLCLEFSKIENSNFNSIYKNYSKLIPIIGEFIVGQKEPYEYLIKSIEEFINQEELINLMEINNFQKCNYRNFSSGIVSIHSGWKL